MSDENTTAAVEEHQAETATVEATPVAAAETVPFEALPPQVVAEAIPAPSAENVTPAAPADPAHDKAVRLAGAIEALARDLASRGGSGACDRAEAVMTKYLDSKPFSVGPASPEYRANYDAVFGAKGKNRMPKAILKTSKKSTKKPVKKSKKG